MFKMALGCIIFFFSFVIVVFFFKLEPEDPVTTIQYKDWVMITLTSLSAMLVILTVIIALAGFFTIRNFEKIASEAGANAARDQFQKLYGDSLQVDPESVDSFDS